GTAQNAERDQRLQSGDILGPALKRSCIRMAARSALESCPRSAVSCNPKGSPLASGRGIDTAGVPNAVHGAFIRGSPLVDKPKGAGPVAAGVRITGVDLKIAASVTLDPEMYRFASVYRSSVIFRPSRTRSSNG